MPDIWFDVDAELAEVPVNIFPLVDDTDFKSREASVAYNATGMDLVWNFVTSAGALSQTAVTPSNSGNYLWTNQGDGMYSIQIPASGGATINNDTEGYGWFTGIATGILAWRSPIFGFRAAAINDALVDGGDYLDVNAVQLGGTVQTGRDIGASVLLSSGTGTGQISLSSGAVLLQATQTGVTIPTVTTLTNAPSDSAGVTTLLSRLTSTRSGYLDNLEHIPLASSDYSAAAGSGSNTEVITVTDGVNPLEGAQVWVTTDTAGANTVASGFTDTLGKLTVYLDTGTYYVWKQLARYTFTNPSTLTVPST